MSCSRWIIATSTRWITTTSAEDEVNFWSGLCLLGAASRPLKCRGAMRRVVSVCAAVLLCSAVSAPGASALVLYSKEEALRVAFPKAERIQTQTFFLTPQQVRAGLRLWRMRRSIPSWPPFTSARLPTRCRATPLLRRILCAPFRKTFLIVVSPEGRLQKLLVLAFYEPPEYLPSARWLQQFDQKPLTSSLRLRQGHPRYYGFHPDRSGRYPRRAEVLALFQILIQEKPPHPGPLPRGERG